MSATRPSTGWHERSTAEVLHELETSGNGLTATEASARKARYGPNTLPERRGPTVPRLLLEQLATPLMAALIGSGVLALALGRHEDGGVVLAVVVLNAVIGVAQEHRAGRAIAALGRLIAEPARVRRDGAWVQIPAEEIVPGDLLEVAQGESVTADLRLLEASALRAQEAALTGESEPVAKRPGAAPATTAIGERTGVLHAGTIVVAGTGRGVAVATGAATELGRIATLVDSVDRLATPLTRSLDRFGRIVTVAIALAAAALAGVAILRGFAAADAALAGIGIAVAAVPEGLPAVVTIALAIGVQRMARRRAIIRRLPAVETLGATTVIATDKTGTLTRNEMTVQAVVTRAGASRPGDATCSAEAIDVLRAGILCNDAIPAGEGTGALGDPTEIALVQAAADAGLDVTRERAARPRLATRPFDADAKLMATLHADPRGARVAIVKGAPEAILEVCRGDVAWAAAAVEERAARGERVLVMARTTAVDGSALPARLDRLELLGLESMKDPLRPGAREAVRDCHRAGIRVAMITGDHPHTAAAIAASLNLRTEPVVTGADLARLDDDALAGLAAVADVYARVAPEQKLRLVRALQRSGAVVAMTGDGVNDAPALRQADIGVAMGRGGTAAAKEAADMVLADDDISTLAAAVAEGRRAYDNLVKALAFVLPTSLGQALIIAISVLVFPAIGGVPELPVEPVQILWINLIVAVALALPLALEAPEPDAMRRPPRDPRAPLLTRALVVRTVLVAGLLAGVAIGLFALERHHQLAAGAPVDDALAHARTTAVTGAVLLQAVYLLACRSLTRPNAEIGRWSNPSVYLGIGVVLILQSAFVALPAMNTAFGSTHLDARQIALGVACALLVLPLTLILERGPHRHGRGR